MKQAAHMDVASCLHEPDLAGEATRDVDSRL